MASGNFISSTGTNANLYVVWSSTTNVAANTSSVTAVVYLRSYTMRFTALANSYITINGNQLKFNGKAVNKSSSSLTDTELARHTVTVSHNTDGTKSITITANLDFNGTVSGKYIDDINASKTVALDTIPRTSGLSVSATSINTGASLKATISPANTSFTHKVAYIIGNTTMFTSPTIAAGTKEYSYTIQDSWLPKLNSTNMVVRLFTYNGSTLLGSTDKSVTVSVSSTTVPTVQSLTPTVVNGLSGGKIVATGGFCVEGKSQVKLEVKATAGSGSSLNSYVFSGPNINGATSTLTSTSATVTSSIIKSNGSLTYGVIAKDGRPNRQSEKKTTSVTVYPYAQPQITSITAERCLADGTPNSDGTYAKVTVKASYSAVGGANQRVVTLYSSKDNYATGTVVLPATNTTDTYSNVYGSGFAAGTSYTIRAVITDAYNTGTTIQKSATLGVAERILNIAKHGNGVSVGGLSSVTSPTADGKFECHWGADFKNGATISNGLTVNGTISAPNGVSTSSFSTLTGYKLLTNIDLNTITFAGTYGCLNCTNDPPSAYQYGMLEVIMYSSHWLIQRYTSLNSDGTIGAKYERSYYGGSTWTDWVAQYPLSATNTGYQKLPTGVIIQWGILAINASTSSQSITFPISFKNRCGSVICQNVYSNSKNIGYSVASVGVNGFVAHPYVTTTNAVPAVATMLYWMAIGY